jgi:hypothetical protein
VRQIEPRAGHDDAENQHHDDEDGKENQDGVALGFQNFTFKKES